MKDFSHPFFDEIYFFNTLKSSFKKAESMIKNYQVNGNFLIIANKESSSVGRDKNIWYAPLGGLWFTIGLNGFKFGNELTIFMGEVVHQTIKDYLSIKNQLFLKWPNDIYYQNRKLAGIITHHLPFFDYYIVGIGINTNIYPNELKDTSISLKEITDREIDNKMFLNKFCDNLYEKLPIFMENGLDHNYFNEYSLLTGRQVTLKTVFDTFSGTVLGINKKGALLIKLPSGIIQPFYSGSIVEF